LDRFKAIIVVDGNSLADRLPLQLASNSVIFKQDSPHIEFWYHDAIPGKHYISFQRDLSDLEEKLEEVLRNDTLMQEIVLAANEFALRRLNPDTTKCYWAQLLDKYSRFKSKTPIYYILELMTFFSSTIRHVATPITPDEIAEQHCS
jgi:hypothetical protein